jgi:hypothetical protein
MAFARACIASFDWARAWNGMSVKGTSNTHRATTNS